MSRSIIVSVLCVAAISALSAATSEAQVISRHNPYRSFSTHGVNYGSQQWELHRRYGNGRASGYGVMRSGGRR